MILGVSGPSGSGKTTIARALRQLFASSTSHAVQILHQDDFYKPEKDIPVKKTRAGWVTNWDCPEAIEMDRLIKTLKSYKEHGRFPDEVKEDLMKRAKEDQNDQGSAGVSSSVIDTLERECMVPHLQNDLLIVDGFMLYQSPEIIRLLDLPVLLRGSFSVLKDRREQRSGYVTLEGFWQDPEHYFEDCVWPEYVKSHGKLFQDGNVEGSVKDDVRVVVDRRVDMSLDESFICVIDAIRKFQGLTMT